MRIKKIGNTSAMALMIDVSDSKLTYPAFSERVSTWTVGLLTPSSSAAFTASSRVMSGTESFSRSDTLST